MWDNRGDKKNPRAPDYRCKDQDCNHKIWLTKRQGRNQTPSGNGAGLDERTKQYLILVENINRSTATTVAGLMTGQGAGPEAVAGTLSLISQVHDKFLALSRADMAAYTASIQKPKPEPDPEPDPEPEPEPDAGGIKW